MSKQFRNETEFDEVIDDIVAARLEKQIRFVVDKKIENLSDAFEDKISHFFEEKTNIMKIKQDLNHKLQKRTENLQNKIKQILFNHEKELDDDDDYITKQTLFFQNQFNSNLEEKLLPFFQKYENIITEHEIVIKNLENKLDLFHQETILRSNQAIKYEILCQELEQQNHFLKIELELKQKQIESVEFKQIHDKIDYLEKEISEEKGKKKHKNNKNNKNKKNANQDDKKEGNQEDKKELNEVIEFKKIKGPFGLRGIEIFDEYDKERIKTIEIKNWENEEQINNINEKLIKMRDKMEVNFNLYKDYNRMTEKDLNDQLRETNGKLNHFLMIMLNRDKDLKDIEGKIKKENGKNNKNLGEIKKKINQIIIIMRKNKDLFIEK